jgi:hypothetical protein
MMTKMAEGDVFEEVEEDHGQNPNVKVQMSNECQSPKFLPAGGRYQKSSVKWK